MRVIPPFDEFGNLPPGLHQAILVEIESRFGSATEIRRAQIESVRWMVDLATRAGAERIVLNGSFVTGIMEPNDVDCVILFRPGGLRDRQALKELRAGLPFLDISLARMRAFENLVDRFFATDRGGRSKGMVEVIGWK